MPMYTYRCEAGHTFEQRGKMDGSDAPTTCPLTTFRKTRVTGVDGSVEHFDAEEVICACPVQKVLSAPARVFPGADSWRH